MQAVVLAGGLGTRLRPITESIPKPMVTVGGVPYLEHQLRFLKQQAITDVVLCTGYLSEQIEQYFGDGSRHGISIHYSREPRPLGTGGALRLARPLIRDEFLVIYGDSYLPIDYHLPWMKLISSSATGLMVIYKDDTGETGVQNNIAMEDDGCIRRYNKDSVDTQGLQYIEAGVLAFRRELFEMIPADAVLSLEKDVYPLLIQREKLIGFVTKQRFYDIGTPERLAVLENLFHDHN
jgi:NDP-sugar pyrophosphorylase family protein